MSAPSYDAGERLRIMVAANGALRVDHGAREVAVTGKSVKRLLRLRLGKDGRKPTLTGEFLEALTMGV